MSYQMATIPPRRDKVINVNDPRLLQIFEGINVFHSTNALIVRDCGQVMCLAEEVGEFVKQARRYLGLARTPADDSTFGKMSTELADVVIASAMAALTFGIDLNSAIEDKLGEIKSRGGI